MIENRLKKNYKKIKKWLDKNTITAYRLYNKDIPEYPYIIDIYNSYAVVYEKGPKFNKTQTVHFEHDDFENLREEKQKLIISALKSVLGILEGSILFKTRELKGHKGNDQYQKRNFQDLKLEIREESRKYLVNLYDYIDTGLFLDHRWLRRKLQESAREKSCLNLFSYTGSISVAMALGFAREVVSVDMSKTYTEWAKENFKTNEILGPQHRFISDNVFTFLKENESYFDLIVCDPPSFSNSKKMTSEFDLARDHIGLINLCMKNLIKDGVLYFSTNLRKFALSKDICEKYSAKDISQQSLDIDFNTNTKRYLYEITFRPKPK